MSLRIYTPSPPAASSCYPGTYGSHARICGTTTYPGITTPRYRVAFAIYRNIRKFSRKFSAERCITFLPPSCSRPAPPPPSARPLPHAHVSIYYNLITIKRLTTHEISLIKDVAENEVLYFPPVTEDFSLIHSCAT